MGTGRDNEGAQWKFFHIFLPHWLNNRWVLCSSWEPWWLRTSLCCSSSTCPALTVTATTLLCRYNEYRTRNVCVCECQDGTENQYETAQIKVLINELLPSHRTSHTMILSPTLRNETASLWRAEQGKCYRSLKPSKSSSNNQNFTFCPHHTFLSVL